MAIYSEDNNQHNDGSNIEVSVIPNLYRVKWVSELTATNPLDAAKQAREDIINGTSLIFDVEKIRDYNGVAKKKFTVDLLEDDEDAVLENTEK